MGCDARRHPAYRRYAVCATYLFGSLQDRNLADDTINGVARATKTFFNFCVREDLLPESPMKKVSMPKIAQRILPSLTTDDATKLLKACETERDEAIVFFLLDTGVRATETPNIW